MSAGLERACLIVVPTFNEAANIATLVRALRAVTPAHVLVVDDNSPDGTGNLAEAISRSDPRVHVLRRPAKLGIGKAYVAGFRWGLERGYQRFFEMDADLSHEPRYLPLLNDALDHGADVVIGSRSVEGGAIEGWGPLRYLLSKGGSLYARTLLGVSVRDMTSGFKGYTRAALRAIDVETLTTNGYAFQIETTYRAIRRGLRVEEVPIVFVDRRAGRSKMGRGDVIEAVTTVLALRRHR